MHKEQQRQQHLISNSIIPKLAVITLSIVLLTGISLLPAIQVGVYGRVQQQQQQQPKRGEEEDAPLKAVQDSTKSAFI